MDIQFYGANCIKITSNKATIVIDDNLQDLGCKPIAKSGDIVIGTMSKITPPEDPAIFIDQPGEYEVSDCSIKGIAVRAHIDELNQRSGVAYRIDSNDIRVAVVGHIYPDIDEATLEAIGVVDVLIVPVGGGGFTLAPIGAHKVISAVGPKLIIPTHYANNSLKYEVSQVTLEEALKTLGEVSETTTKLKLKSTDLPDIAKVVVVEPQIN